jgi:CIC family chloride channel protein
MEPLIEKLTSRLEIPQRLRAIVRARESSLIALAALAGVVAGLVVAAMGTGVDFLHRWLFRLGPEVRLSGMPRLDPLVALAVPLVGGLVFGVARELIARWRPEREIDPIEANALHGGRMSVVGSIIVALQTVWSTGVGASVGLEAGYTQLAGGIASRLGVAFRLRRADLRILVGCGAAAGIAGAFGAPLAGAFYGFELIIGGYSPNNLAPVGVAALIGYVVAHALAASEVGIVAPTQITFATHDIVVAAVIGLLAAGTGILIMKAVAVCESLFARMQVRPSLRTMAGGLAVGILAIAAPQVMSSGHGALHLTGIVQLPILTIALFFCLKIAASILSLGSGFRGGLFFSSLLIGALGGHLVAAALSVVWPAASFDSNAYAVIGMSALSASVIGGPLTMTFIALETTGDLWLATAVLIAVMVSSQVTREVFGFSFATWRFHLRGETIRSAADIGWMRDLTVGKMMRRDVRTASTEMNIAAFKEAFPLGSSAAVVAVDEHGHYAGMVLVADAHAGEADSEASIKKLLRYTDIVLVPGMTIKDAVLAFDRAEAEALPVVDSYLDRHVTGFLTEAYALRRYSAELERRRLEVAGEE